MRIDFDASGRAVFALRTLRRSLAGDAPHPSAVVSLALDDDEYPELCEAIATDPTPYALVNGALCRDGKPLDAGPALVAPADRRDLRPLTRALRQFLDAPEPTAAQTTAALRALIRLTGVLLAAARDDA